MIMNNIINIEFNVYLGCITKFSFHGCLIYFLIVSQSTMKGHYALVL